MKVTLQYLNDIHGKIHAVQLPLSEWEKLMAKLKRYEQALKLKSDLEEAFQQVAVLKKKRGHKQTLNEFISPTGNQYRKPF